MEKIFDQLASATKADLIPKMKKQFIEQINVAAQKIVSEHFADRIAHTSTGIKKIKGAGTLEIEEFLAKKFGTIEMQQLMHDYFEKNFQRIFTDTMEQAIKHGVNKVAFNDARTLAQQKSSRNQNLKETT